MTANSTFYDPSPDDPRIIAVLEARGRLDAAFASQNADAFEALTQADFVVHAPNNAVLHRAFVVARFREGAMNYSEGKATSIEFAGLRGDDVVLMGEETIRPMAPAPHAGKTLRRRFTDIWNQDEGAWKLAIRQATIVSME